MRFDPGNQDLRSEDDLVHWFKDLFKEGNYREASTLLEVATRGKNEVSIIYTWIELTKGGLDELELCKLVHRVMAARVLACFKVPMGLAGISIMPAIPACFS